MAGLIEGFVKEPGDNVLSKLVNDKDGPDGADGARARPRPMRSFC